MKLMLLSLLGVTVMVLVEGWAVVDAVYVHSSPANPSAMALTGARIYCRLYSSTLLLSTGFIGCELAAMVSEPNFISCTRATLCDHSLTAIGALSR